MTMQKIEELNHTHDRKAKPEAVTAQAITEATRFVTLLEKEQAKVNDALGTWFDVAFDLNNQDGTKQIARRLEYPFQQEAQRSWIALYGNRTQKELETNDPEALKRNTVRFCASEQLKYREAAWYGPSEDDQRFKNLGADFNGWSSVPDNQYGEPDAAKIDALERLNETNFWHLYCLAQWNMWNNLYSLITGEAFVYTAKMVFNEGNSGNFGRKGPVTAARTQAFNDMLTRYKAGGSTLVKAAG